jgi:hypothetical protein
MKRPNDDASPLTPGRNPLTRSGGPRTAAELTGASPTHYNLFSSPLFAAVTFAFLDQQAS